MDLRTAPRDVARLRTPGHAALAAVALSVVVEVVAPVDSLPALLLAVGTVSVAYVARHTSAASNLERATGAGPIGWGLGAAVAGAGIGATYLLGTPVPFCDGWPHRGCLTGYGWASAVFVATGVLAGSLGRHRRFSGTAVGPASDVFGGPAAVVGRVEPAGPTVEAPVTGREAVAYRHAVQRRLPGTGSPAHRTVSYDGDSVAFYVRDGSGRLLVRPESFDEHLVRRFWPAKTVDRTDADPPGPDRDAHRLREWALTPDEVVAVWGTASEVSRAEYPEPVVVGLEGPVAVAAAPRDVVANEFRWRVFVAAGLLVLVGGGSFLAMLATAL